MCDWNDLEWMHLQQAIAEAPAATGAYAVRCMKAGRAIPICRALATDKSGILCFGQSAGLAVRLRTFARAAERGQAPHAEGIRYHAADYSHRGLPYADLQVTWRAFENEAQAKEQEREWFNEYFGRFGELPPLNRQGG